MYSIYDIVLRTEEYTNTLASLSVGYVQECCKQPFSKWEEVNNSVLSDETESITFPSQAIIT